MTRTLDLGCGPAKEPGAFGVDSRPLEGVDCVHNLNEYPWPIKDDSFDKVRATHIVEHVDDVPGFFGEIHRVCASGAQVFIETPHFSNRCSYCDPTHKHAFSVRFIEFIARGEPWKPSGKFAVARSWLLEHHHDIKPLTDENAFAVESVFLTFSRIFRMCGLEKLANKKIDFYEFYCAGLFPARDIRIRLRVQKGS